MRPCECGVYSRGPLSLPPCIPIPSCPCTLSPHAAAPFPPPHGGGATMTWRLLQATTLLAPPSQVSASPPVPWCAPAITSGTTCLHAAAGRPPSLPAAAHISTCSSKLANDADDDDDDHSCRWWGGQQNFHGFRKQLMEQGQRRGHRLRRGSSWWWRAVHLLPMHRIASIILATRATVNAYPWKRH